MMTRTAADVEDAVFYELPSLPPHEPPEPPQSPEQRRTGRATLLALVGLTSALVAAVLLGRPQSPDLAAALRAQPVVSRAPAPEPAPEPLPVKVETPTPAPATHVAVAHPDAQVVAGLEKACRRLPHGRVSCACWAEALVNRYPDGALGRLTPDEQGAVSWTIATGCSRLPKRSTR